MRASLAGGPCHWYSSRLPSIVTWLLWSFFGNALGDNLPKFSLQDLTDWTDWK